MVVPFISQVKQKSCDPVPRLGLYRLYTHICLRRGTQHTLFVLFSLSLCQFSGFCLLVGSLVGCCRYFVAVESAHLFVWLIDCFVVGSIASFAWLLLVMLAVYILYINMVSSIPHPDIFLPYPPRPTYSPFCDGGGPCIFPFSILLTTRVQFVRC